MIWNSTRCTPPSCCRVKASEIARILQPSALIREKYPKTWHKDRVYGAGDGGPRESCCGVSKSKDRCIHHGAPGLTYQWALFTTEVGSDNRGGPRRRTFRACRNQVTAVDIIGSCINSGFWIRANRGRSILDKRQEGWIYYPVYSSFWKLLFHFHQRWNWYTPPWGYFG